MPSLYKLIARAVSNSDHFVVLWPIDIQLVYLKVFLCQFIYLLELLTQNILFLQ